VIKYQQPWTRRRYVSKATKRAPPETLLVWMGEQVDENLFLASLTVAEIRRGILEKPAGRKRNQPDAWKAPSALFAGRVLPLLGAFAKPAKQRWELSGSNASRPDRFPRLQRR
jgi:hypothetical protein